jgi:hypothetical protein
MHPAVGANLSWALLLVVLCLGFQAGANAQESVGAVVFTVPKAYPIERYEADWNKNPFTLKTAPTLLAQDSFAKDLSIGSYYGDTQDPTVVVVNTKTGERTSLKKSKAATNGMQLKTVMLGGSRKDMVVEVTLGAETSEVRYNDDYMKQLAATAEGARGAAGKAPGVPGQRPGVPPPAGGMPVRGPVPGAPPVTSQVPLPTRPQGNPGMGVPNAGFASRPLGTPASAPMTAASRNVNPSVSLGGSGVSAGGPPEVPRRRLIGPAQ